MVVAAYTMAGGMLAAVWTDLVQGVLMVVMSVGLFIFAVQVAGGWIPMLDTISTTSAELLSVALLGMFTDTWQMVFIAVPIFAVIMMLLGSLHSDGSWERVSTLAIVAYCSGLGVLVLWSILTAAGDAMLWGLPMSMGVIFYLLWPYTAVGAGLL
ncbi:hypothetical protein H483_0109325 [Dietzia sp. UCD-THP]|nr:hypothetical protein H483_0109325 [Dietzia sp. UCD-THP]